MHTLARDALNQPPPLVDFNAFERYPALREALVREGDRWAQGQHAAVPMLRQEPALASEWESRITSTDVAALDALRAIAKDPDGLPAFLAECELASGADRRFDAYLRRLKDALAVQDPQWSARRTVEDLGAALQASLVLRDAPAAVADAFCASRLEPREGGCACGTLPSGSDFDTIMERAWPR